MYATPPPQSIEVNGPRHVAHSQTIQALPHQISINGDFLRRDGSDPNKTSFAVDSDFTHASTITVAPDSGAVLYPMLAVRQVLVVVKSLKILVKMGKTQNEVITELLKNGAKSEQVVVKNLKVKTFEKYTRCRVTIDHEVDGYVSEDNGVTYKLGKTNVVFISLFNLVNALRDTEYDVVIDHICDHPQSMVVLLKDAKVTLVQQNVKAGDTPDGVDAPLEHDAIYWHCKAIDFSDAAKLRLDKIVDKMLGL